MIDTLDPAALDAFTGELIAAGFEPESPDRWAGPVPDSLRTMTGADVMTIRLYDGWPYRPPAVFVKDLPIGRHRNASGHVCLWESGDPSLEWLTLPAIHERIKVWVSGAQGEATANDPGLDPHLIFRGDDAGLATIDLTERPVGSAAMEDLLATEKDGVLKIGAGDVLGRWYVVDPAPQIPQKLSDLDPFLTDEQRADLKAVVEAVGSPDSKSFVVFAWRTPAGPNLLVLKLDTTEAGTLKISTYEAARTDHEILLLRAGPDAAALRDKTVVIIGIGAVGSHVAGLLARSGVGHELVFDYERLRPGDVVRHAAYRVSVGRSKVDAVETMNKVTAPWMTTDIFDGAMWEPKVIGMAVGMADLVIDATGLANFTAQASEICRQKQRPLVSVALYRRGSVGRVRYQAAHPMIPIIDRPGIKRFPVIPPGPDEEGASWEAGCMASVAQASPIAVVSIAATAARVAIDALMGRDDQDRDVLDVYQTLGVASFDIAGTTVTR